MYIKHNVGEANDTGENAELHNNLELSNILSYYAL